MKLFHTVDRAYGSLDAQLLSSVTAGSFTLSNLNILGSQTWDTPSGEQCVLSIENEQILGTMAESGGTLTFTIATNGRGYAGTTAATHAANTVGYFRMISTMYEVIKDEVASHVQGLIAYDGVTPTVTSATVLTVAGSDETAKFTAGRVVLVKISSTWHRCVVRSSSFSTNTTVNVTSDTLPGSGTITSVAFEFNQSVNKPVDYQLIKEATNVPASNPPSGYIWLYAKGKRWFCKNSDGVIHRMNDVQATASSSAGVLTLDWSLANVYDCTLTENITGVTHQNGIEGEQYILRLKQHASSAKTVVLGTSGGTRFSNSLASYTMTTTTGAYDILTFIFNNTDAKYDLMVATKGFQSSPTQTASPFSETFTAGGTITALDAVYIKASDGKAYSCDADADESTYNFVGFAVSGSTVNNPVVVYLPGATLDGFGGLTTGDTLFLSGTTGAIANTPHATRIARVAKAVSATKILILEPKFVRYGSQAISTTGDTTQTTGFYPTKITMYGAAAKVATAPSLAFANESFGFISNAAAGNSNFIGALSVSVRSTTNGIDNGGVGLAASVTAKSQTGFTLNCSARDASWSGHTVYWMAESD